MSYIKNRNIAIAVISICILVFLMACIFYADTYSYVPKNQRYTLSNNSEIRLFIGESQELEIETGDVYVNGVNKKIGINIDTSNIKMTSFNLSDSLLHMMYLTSTGYTELYMGKDINSMANSNDIENLKSAIKSPNLKMEIDETSGSSSIYSLYKEGIVCVKNVVTTDDGTESFIYGEDTNNEISSTAKLASSIRDYSWYFENEAYEMPMVLNISGLNSVNLNELLGDISISFNSTQEICTISDIFGNELLTVSRVDNSYLGLNSDKLWESEEYSNIYLYEGYKDIESKTYKCFAIQTSDGMYAFKICNVSKENVESLIASLGISADDAKLPTNIPIERQKA